MAFYNLTNVTGTTNFVQVTQGINVLSEGMFGIMLLASISIIVFGTLKFRTVAETGTIIAATSFVTFIMSVILNTMSLLPNYVIAITFVMVLGSIAMLVARNESG